MKKTVLVLIFLSAFGLLMNGCQRDTGGLTIKNGVLMVAVEPSYPPMEYLASDGVTLIGFDIDLANAIAGKLDLRTEFVETSWDGIFAGVDTRRYDCIISGVTITPERLQRHNFSRPYMQNTIAIVMPRNSSRTVNSPWDLAGLRVSYQDETTADFFMQDLAAQGLAFAPFEYDRMMYCFEELRLGRVDTVVTDLIVAYEYIGRSDFFEIVWQGGEEELGIALRKGNDALTEAIDNALAELFEDGTMLRLSLHHFNGLDLVSAVMQD